MSVSVRVDIDKLFIVPQNTPIITIQLHSIDISLSVWRGGGGWGCCWYQSAMIVCCWSSDRIIIFSTIIVSNWTAASVSWLIPYNKETSFFIIKNFNTRWSSIDRVNIVHLLYCDRWKPFFLFYPVVVYFNNPHCSLMKEPSPHQLNYTGVRNELWLPLARTLNTALVVFSHLSAFVKELSFDVVSLL